MWENRKVAIGRQHGMPGYWERRVVNKVMLFLGL